MPKSPLSKISLLLSVMLLFSACGSVETPTDSVVHLREVKVQTAKESKYLQRTLSYPATITASQNFKILAKATGNAKQVNFNLGDKVKAGQILMRIDDSSGSQNSVSQVEQLRISMEQAKKSLDLAQKNYQSLQASMQKDLQNSALNQDNAKLTQENTLKSTDANRANADLMVENAKINLEQAQNTLEDKKILLAQNLTDTETNAVTTISTVSDAFSSILRNLDASFDFDSKNEISLNYQSSLGALNSATLNEAENAYLQTKREYESFLISAQGETATRLDSLLVLIDSLDTTLANVWKMLENTITSNDLPLSSSAGTSLGSLRSLVSGYQTQVNGYKNQINGAKQALISLKLNQTSTVSSLEKAVAIAEKQVRIAEENLKNIDSSMDTQQNQTDFAVDLRQNEYESLKLKFAFQLQSAQTQKEQAQLQYNNAQLAWSSLVDNYLIKSQIDGVVSQKLIEEGGAVGPGQVIAIISQNNQSKAQFFMDGEYLPYLHLGQSVKLTDNDGMTLNSKINAISPQADSLSKRFLIEVIPEKSAQMFPMGTVLTAEITLKILPTKQGFYLPLSAVNIGQNEKSIFLIVGEKAQRLPIELGNVEGDFIEIIADLKDTDLIVVDGNKLITDQEKVKIQE